MKAETWDALIHASAALSHPYLDEALARLHDSLFGLPWLGRLEMRVMSGDSEPVCLGFAKSLGGGIHGTVSPCQFEEERDGVAVTVKAGLLGGGDLPGFEEYLASLRGIAVVLAAKVAVHKSIGAAFRRANEIPKSFEADDLRVDFAQRRVYTRGEEVELTPKEYQVLCLLAENPGRVVFREEILGDVWGGEFRDEYQYLRNYISNLRRKLEKDPEKPRYILSRPGMGYYLSRGVSTLAKER